MGKLGKWGCLLLAAVLVLAACGAPAEEAAPSEELNMPNPASAYCEAQGGKVEIRSDASGNEYGVCKFDDGSECDEWAFYRDECKPGDMQVAPEPESPAFELPNPASAHCEEQGGALEMRQDSSGGTYGVCIFADGTECDEWAFYRGECQPGQMETAPEPGQ